MTTPSPAPEVIEVPDLADFASFDALSELENLGLEALFRSDGRFVDPNWLLVVAEQTPAPGELVPVGTRVVLDLADLPRPEHSISIDGELITVVVTASLKELEARAIAHDIAEQPLPEGAYFINFNCSSGATASADNRQANGELSMGARGEAILGLNSGVYRVEMREGATCP